MEIKITSPAGVKLLTEKKYCLENIDVIPVLQDKSVTPGDTQQVVTPDADFAGLGSVTVEPGTITTDATATADDIRLDKTAYGADGKMTGTIVDYNGTSEPTTGKSLAAQIVDRSVKEITADDLKGINVIGSYAFINSFDLTSITIPTTTTRIYYYAFRGCSKLTSVVIPNIVTQIDDRAFQNCTNLSSVKMLPTAPPTLGPEVFDGTASNLQIIVPKGTLDTYKTATNWSMYADKMVEADE